MLYFPSLKENFSSPKLGPSNILAYSRVLARTRVLAQCPLDHFWTRAPNHLFPSSERTLCTQPAKLKNLPVRSCARPLTKFQEDRTIEFFARRRHRWPWSRARLLSPLSNRRHRASESCMAPGVSNAMAAVPSARRMLKPSIMMLATRKYMSGTTVVRENVSRRAQT